MIEDEPMLLMLIEDILDQLGHSVSQTCVRLKDALEAIEADSFDTVFLDLNLRGERADPVAERLRELNIPFIIATGGVRDDVPDGAAAVLIKPYHFNDIERAIDKVRGALASS